MGAHVLLNLFNELGKSDKMRGLSSILILFGDEFNKLNKNNSTNVRFYLSYDINITLKYHFLSKSVIIFSICTQRCYKRNNVSPKSENH